MATQMFLLRERCMSHLPKSTQLKHPMLQRSFSDPGKGGLPEKSPEEESIVPNASNTELSLCSHNPVECHLPRTRGTGAEAANTLQGGAPNLEETLQGPSDFTLRQVSNHIRNDSLPPGESSDLVVPGGKESGKKLKIFFEINGAHVFIRLEKGATVADMLCHAVVLSMCERMGTRSERVYDRFGAELPLNLRLTADNHFILK